MVISKVVPAGTPVPTPAAASAADGPATSSVSASLDVAVVAGRVRLVEMIFPPRVNQTATVVVRVGWPVSTPVDPGGAVVAGPDGSTVDGLAGGGGSVGAVPLDPDWLVPQADTRMAVAASSIVARRFMVFLPCGCLAPHGPRRPSPPLHQRATVVLPAAGPGTRCPHRSRCAPRSRCRAAWRSPELWPDRGRCRRLTGRGRLCRNGRTGARGAPVRCRGRGR